MATPFLTKRGRKIDDVFLSRYTSYSQLTYFFRSFTTLQEQQNKKVFFLFLFSTVQYENLSKGYLIKTQQRWFLFSPHASSSTPYFLRELSLSRIRWLSSSISLLNCKNARLADWSLLLLLLLNIFPHFWLSHMREKNKVGMHVWQIIWKITCEINQIKNFSLRNEERNITSCS